MNFSPTQETDDKEILKIQSLKCLDLKQNAIFISLSQKKTPRHRNVS